MKVFIEVSLDAYFPSLSPGLQRQIQDEVNRLLNEEDRIKVRTAGQGATPKGVVRSWTNEGDSSVLGSPYRSFEITEKRAKRGQIAKVVFELQKSGRKIMRSTEIVEIIKRISPDAAPTLVLNQLWGYGYIENRGLSVPQDSALASRADQVL